MVSYGNYNLKKKKKGKKIITAVIVTVAIILVGIFVIGIIAGSDGENMEQVSTAVEENTDLKIQIGELNDEIAKLKEENENLKAELESRPTIMPAPTGSPLPTSSPAPSDSSLISPR